MPLVPLLMLSMENLFSECSLADLIQCELKAEILLLKVKMICALLTRDQCICFNVEGMITEWCSKPQSLPAPTLPPPPPYTTGQ